MDGWIGRYVVAISVFSAENPSYCRAIGNAVASQPVGNDGASFCKIQFTDSFFACGDVVVVVVAVVALAVVMVVVSVVVVVVVVVVVCSEVVVVVVGCMVVVIASVPGVLSATR